MSKSKYIRNSDHCAVCEQYPKENIVDPLDRGNFRNLSSCCPRFGSNLADLFGQKRKRPVCATVLAWFGNEINHFNLGSFLVLG